MVTQHDDRKVKETAEQAVVGFGFDPVALRQKYREEREKRLREDSSDQCIEVKGEFGPEMSPVIAQVTLLTFAG